MRLGIAADHGGFELKGRIAAELKALGHEMLDFGAYELASGDDYPDFVVPMARAVAMSEVERGLAICGSGVGACIAANKVPGVRAALVTEIFSAHQGVEDVATAADLFRPTYERLQGRDGFVSLEVNPHLALDTRGTVVEARRLWSALDRPKVFIKVPATLEGLRSIRQLISEGINVNVTLLFGLPRYREVADAYISGLETRAAKGLPIERVASVASFFLSRIDVLADPLLEKSIEKSGAAAGVATGLRGQTAIASAKMAYQIYKEVSSSGRFRKLAALGARPQRVLWASTGTKNPEYSDVKYVEALIGPETINTLPPETLKAYRDHGDPAPRLEEHPEEAALNLKRLSELGIDLDEVTQKLEDQGIEKFNKPYDTLMANLGKKHTAALGLA
jgi:transaldolase